MKVLLLMLNSKYIHASPTPYCLLAGIRTFGKTVRDADIIEGTVNETEEAVYRRITEKNPDVVCASAYIWNIVYLTKLITRDRKENPKRIWILGGPEVAYRPEEILRGNDRPDYVLTGEGEAVLPPLLDGIAEGNNMQSLPGVSFLSEHTFQTSPPPFPLENVPSPLDAGYSEAAKGRITYCETSRGCPFFCAFCLSGREGGLRFFDEEKAISDLLTLAASGGKTVKLVDRTFNADRRRADRIWERLIRAYTEKEIPNDVTFHFELEGDLLDEKSLSVLKKAPKGLFRFEIGLQSVTPKVLEAVGRHADTERILKNARELISYGNSVVHLDLIAGLPNETEETYLESFRRAYAVRPHELQLGFLKLLSGSRMKQSPEKYPMTVSDNPPYEVSETPTMPKENLFKLHKFEDAFDKIWNSGRFSETVKAIEERTDPVLFYTEVGESLFESPVAGPDALGERLLTLYGPSVGEDVLRDALLLDRLASNADPRLPAYLRRTDSRFAGLRAAYGGKVGILSRNRFVYVPLGSERDPVTNRFPLILDSLVTIEGDIK